MSFSFYFVTSLSDVIEVAIAHAKIIVKDAEKHEKEKHNTYIWLKIFQRNSDYICFYS